MNCKGILRKTSPIKKRNLTTHLVNAQQKTDNVQLIDHNHANDIDDGFDSDFTNSTKYQFSTIHTTQKTKNKLQQLKNLTVKEATLANLSPHSKGIVAEKVKNIVQKIQIPFSKF